MESSSAADSKFNILEKVTYNASVSSVFQKDHKQFGKKHMFDGKEATCWNSDQGLPQHVTFKFETMPVSRIVGVRYVS